MPGSLDIGTLDIAGPGLPTGATGATAATRFVGGTTSGAPVTGTFAKGDFVVDQAGLTWVCTAAGSPGTWASDIAVMSPGVQGAEMNTAFTMSPAYYGLASWNVNLNGLANANQTPATGVTYQGRIWLPKATAISKIWYLSRTAAVGGTAGATPTVTGPITLPTTPITLSATTNLNAGGGILYANSSVGWVPLTYATVSGSTITGVTNPAYANGATIANGASSQYSVNYLTLYSDDGQTLLAITADQVANFAGTGPMSPTLTAINNQSLTLAAGWYRIGLLESYATSGVGLFGPGAAASSLAVTATNQNSLWTRIGAATQLNLPNTFTPSSGSIGNAVPVWLGIST